MQLFAYRECSQIRCFPPSAFNRHTGVHRQNIWHWWLRHSVDCICDRSDFSGVGRGIRSLNLNGVGRLFSEPQCTPTLNLNQIHNPLSGFAVTFVGLLAIAAGSSIRLGERCVFHHQ